MDSTINEITLSYKKRKTKFGTARCPMESEQVARDIFKQSKVQMELKEYFFIIFLNHSNEVIGYNKLSEGGITGTVADVRLIFATALKCLASGVILVHNHPSGNMNPSMADQKLTEQIKHAGRLLDILLLDHLILTTKDYYSFEDEGLL